ncbi:hypothetical protein ACWPKO_06960 [Coraliomargarita sp. W4R53]
MKKSLKFMLCAVSIALFPSCATVPTDPADRELEKKIIGTWEINEDFTYYRYYPDHTYIRFHQFVDVDEVEICKGEWSIQKGILHELENDCYPWEAKYEIRKLSEEKLVVAREDYIVTWKKLPNP